MKVCGSLRSGEDGPGAGAGAGAFVVLGGRVALTEWTGCSFERGVCMRCGQPKKLEHAFPAHPL